MLVAHRERGCNLFVSLFFSEINARIKISAVKQRPKIGYICKSLSAAVSPDKCPYPFKKETLIMLIY